MNIILNMKQYILFKKPTFIFNSKIKQLKQRKFETRLKKNKLTKPVLDFYVLFFTTGL